VIKLKFELIRKMSILLKADNYFFQISQNFMMNIIVMIKKMKQK